MTERISYIVSPLRISDKDSFSEASKEELRVLLALIERGGKDGSVAEIAKRAQVSAARAGASLVFWEEAGVIRKDGAPQTITEEFEERIDSGKIREVSAKDTAKTIRDSRLADMISECATLMQRATLNSAEIKDLTALHDQYALSEEYILTLAAYISEHGKLTVVTAAACNAQLYVTGIVGNVNPKTYSKSVCGINGGENQVQCVVARFINLGEIAFYCQRIVAVAHFTGFSVDHGNIPTFVLTVVPEIAVIVGDFAVGADGAVFSVVGINRPTVQILIFKIIDNVRSFTQRNVGGDGQAADLGG